MTNLLDQETLKITTFLIPWITILLSLIVALWLKDFALKFMQGLSCIHDELQKDYCELQDLRNDN